MNRKEPASVSVPTGPPSQRFHSPPPRASPIGANANAALAISIGQRIELPLLDQDFMAGVQQGSERGFLPADPYPVLGLLKVLRLTRSEPPPPSETLP